MFEEPEIPETIDESEKEIYRDNNYWTNWVI
jgi:hypothetical protein